MQSCMAEATVLSLACGFDNVSNNAQTHAATEEGA